MIAMLEEVHGEIYRGTTSNLDPRIKPTLSNGVDLIFKALGNRHKKGETDMWAP